MKTRSLLLFMCAFLMVSEKLYAGTGKTETATFAGGCFWCVEQPFDNTEGVIEAVSGYTGGTNQDPNYELVSGGNTGHYESVQIKFDPDKISYEELLDIFWMQIDPTDPGGQFADRGSQYRTAIFYHNEEQKRIAEKSKKNLQESGIFNKKIFTPILKAQKFYRAEDYHQDYAEKHPIKYKYYKYRSGRTPFLKKTWSSHKIIEDDSYQKPGDEELRKTLTPLQYKVTQKDGTEPPFNNKYWDNKADGIYVDIVSGEVLYSSKDKYKSGTGWPSFTKALEPSNIIDKEDNSLFVKRTELRSRRADSHLGHVFDDGPPPTGKRHCINSAALRFIPKADLEKEGYGKYLKLFDK